MGHAGRADELAQIVYHIEVESGAALAHDPAGQTESVTFLEVAPQTLAAEAGWNRAGRCAGDYIGAAQVARGHQHYAALLFGQFAENRIDIIAGHQRNVRKHDALRG